MRNSWKIGTAFGIGIYIHITFLILPLFVLYQNGTQGGLVSIVFQMLLIAAVFGCVVLHELGHALMARHFGIATVDITLYPIGGVARLKSTGRNPMQELCIALAGPAVNIVIAIFLLFVALPLAGLAQMAYTGSHFGVLGESLGIDFLLNLMMTNVLLVAFNMIPAFPMDGGRVLRALLSMKMSRLRATEIAARIGSYFAIFAIVLSVVGWFSGGGVPPFLGVLAIFIWFAGQQELYFVRANAQRQSLAPIDVLPADDGDGHYEPVNRGSFSGYVWDERRHAWILWQNGRPVAAFSVPSE